MSQKMADMLTALQNSEPDKAILILQEINAAEMLFLKEIEALCQELNPDQTQRVLSAINRLLIVRSEYASFD